MPFTQPPDTVDALQAAFVVQSASEGIARVRRVHDHSAGAQNINDLVDQPLLRGLRMYFKVLGHGGMQKPMINPVGKAGQAR